MNHIVFILMASFSYKIDLNILNLDRDWWVYEEMEL